MFDRTKNGKKLKGEDQGRSNTEGTEARQSSTPQRARRVRLGEIDRADDRFFLRDKSALAEENLKGLMANIQHEGVQDPIEVASLEGRVVLVKGFLRVEACILLGRKQVHGFGDDMELDAIEVLETDPNELLIRSVLDNSHRRSLDQVERIRAARRLFLAGIIEARAAEALGISPQSYKRDLSIAESRWMFDHVVANEVSPTPAATLLKAIADAEKEYPGIGDRVRVELGRWVEKKKGEIDRKDRMLKAKKGRGQGLSAADKQVRRYLTSQLAEHWAELVRQGNALDDKPDWTFKADLDFEKDLLQIGGVRLDLAKDPVRKLVEVASKLSQLAKDIAPVLQQRYAEERRRDRPTGQGGIRDTGYLRDLGLDDYADEYELEQQELAESGPDGEDDSGFDREGPRSERDLASEVESRTPDGPAAEADTPSGDEGGAR